MSQFRFEISTSLRAPAAEVWAHASTMRGVNEELAPWVRMTAPKAAREKRITDVMPGREAFVSVLLLFSVLPVDVHHLIATKSQAPYPHDRGPVWPQRA